MAIQKSVFNEQEVFDLLESFYGITADKIEPLPLGTANCRKVFAGKSVYFLKEYPEAFSSEDISREIKINDFLLAKSFPTSNFIADKNGNKFNSSNERFFVLQDYIRGDTYSDHNLPDGVLFRSARMLGHMHEVLKEYDLPVEMDPKWAKKFRLSKTVLDYDSLLLKVRGIEDEKIAKRIREDLLFKKNLLFEIKPYGKYFDRLTYKSTHGDYNSLQYICEFHEIKAIVDFASAKKLPAVWEIMRSYMQSARDTKDPSYFDLDKFCEYVREYMRFSELTEWDLKYMPYVYLYQLGRSKYGYREYITNAENKDELLNFAFWRTDVCRMLLDKADTISQKLIAL